MKKKILIFLSMCIVLFVGVIKVSGEELYKNFNELAMKEHEGKPGSNTGTYERRWKRKRWANKMVLAIHGGDMEKGTSELAIATAGFDPSTMKRLNGPKYSFYLFESTLPFGENGRLHITSTHFDDPVAIHILRKTKRAVSYHGFNPQGFGLPENAEIVYLGGLDESLKEIIGQKLIEKGFIVQSPPSAIAGNDKRNIVNRTSLGMGVQIELSTPLRNSFFTNNTIAGRKESTTPRFWDFVHGVREAMDMVN
jgi:phage replication-related protein YjqB (UPF0714/DUF867 family)